MGVRLGGCAGIDPGESSNSSQVLTSSLTSLGTLGKSLPLGNMLVLRTHANSLLSSGRRPGVGLEMPLYLLVITTGQQPRQDGSPMSHFRGASRTSNR